MKPSRLALWSVAVFAGLHSFVHGQCDSVKLVPSQGVGVAHTAAIDGDAIVSGSLDGVAVFFRQVNGVWVEEDVIDPDPPASFFGWSSGIHGDVAAVGGFDLGGPGRVYVYRYDGSAWSLEQTLMASNAVSGDFFGNAVSVGSWGIAVGAPSAPNALGSSGAVYLFEHDGTAWVERQILEPSGPPSVGYALGTSVALDRNANVLVAGAPDEGGFGVAYFYEHTGTSWQFTQKVSTVVQNDIGVSVALDGDLAVVGGTGGGAAGDGAAILFRKVAGTWVEDPTPLQDPLIDSQDLFGFSVAVRGDNILVGDQPGFPFSKPGNVHRFLWNGADWVPLELDSGEANGNSFGRCVSLSDDHAIVGTLSTGVYVFPIPTSGLGLTITPATAQGGDPLSYVATCGSPGAPLFLVITDVSGVPFFLRVVKGTFDSSLRWTRDSFVPPGLGSLSLTFHVLGIAESGKVALSNAETLQLD